MSTETMSTEISSLSLQLEVELISLYSKSKYGTTTDDLLRPDQSRPERLASELDRKGNS
jgi:hypothetical protein